MPGFEVSDIEIIRVSRIIIGVLPALHNIHLSPINEQSTINHKLAINIQLCYGPHFHVLDVDLKEVT